MRPALVDEVAATARARPHEVAIVEVRDSVMAVWTWAALWRESQRLAARFLGLGVRPGDVLACQLPNRAEFVVVTLATLRIGAICCPLMPIFRERELANMLERARARVLVTSDEFHGRHPADEVATLTPRLPALRHVLVVRHRDLASAANRRRAALRGTAAGSRGPRWALPKSTGVSWAWFEQRSDGAQEEAAPEPGRPDPQALAQLLFTSGTTGEPKGVLHRQDVLMAAAVLAIEHLRLGTGDCIYVPSPLAHQTGFLYGMWLALTLGVPQLLQERWDPQRGLHALRYWGGTFVQAATPFLADLVQAVEEGAEPPTALRLFVATGAAVPRALARRAAEKLRTTVCGAFGTTEGCLATLASPRDPPEKTWGTDGRPLPRVEIRVCDAAGHVLPPGQEGHLQTKSPTMFAGYLGRPDWTAEAFTPDGWYRTGDLAVIDAHGYLRICGRVKDVINRGGEKIPVAEIEQLLYQHPAVKEVAVVAMPDPRLTERACAFVVPREASAVDLPALQHFLDEHRVAKPYWPEHLEQVEALPRTPSGKIQKYLLRERARALAPRRQAGANR